MFEKDAEEIAKDIYIHHFDDDVNYPDVLKAIIVGVKKGAEFGYNKANEWHYVKDELPRIINGYFSNDLILLTKDITKHFGSFSFRKDFEVYNTEDIFTLDEVIAWKEIVLPKEIE